MEAMGQRSPTIQERETLMKSTEPRRSGFTPRPTQKLVGRKPPKTTLSLECRHFWRCSTDEATHGHPQLTYKLWLEAGKHSPPFPDRPDSSYNSNVWRNFSKQYGFHANTEGQDVNEMIAAMYPLNIPPPSKVGDHTYGKYLIETPLIQDEKRRKLTIQQTNRDIEEFRKLRLRSEQRYPPIDKTGKIEPPLNFRRHAYRFVPPGTPPSVSPSSPPPDETRIDMFGKVVPRPKRQPYMWKLTYKLNNPEYEAVQQEKEKLLNSKNKTPVPTVHKIPPSQPGATELY